jgi:hypothetical protein
VIETKKLGIDQMMIATTNRQGTTGLRKITGVFLFKGKHKSASRVYWSQRHMNDVEVDDGEDAPCVNPLR